jgi:hypothetical protein
MSTYLGNPYSLVTLVSLDTWHLILLMISTHTFPFDSGHSRSHCGCYRARLTPLLGHPPGRQLLAGRHGIHQELEPSAGL